MTIEYSDTVYLFFSWLGDVITKRRFRKFKTYLFDNGWQRSRAGPILWERHLK